MYYAYIVAGIFLFFMAIAWFCQPPAKPYKYGGTKKQPDSELDDWQNDFFPKYNKN